jgi:hypothetical protein
VKSLKESQYLKHAQYGFGVVSESNAERTTIDFENFGKKKFVTSMMVVELVEGEAPKPRRATRRKKVAVDASVAVAAAS